MVVDELEWWVKEVDVDGFNIGYVIILGIFEEVVDLLIFELRRRGVYFELFDLSEELVMVREKIYGKG